MLFFLITSFNCKENKAIEGTNKNVRSEEKVKEQTPKMILPGAYRTEAYLDLIKDKKIALLVNQTSMIGKVHLTDSLKSLGVEIVKIFAPEHGFRGSADAGEAVKDGVDLKTGIPIRFALW